MVTGQPGSNMKECSCAVLPKALCLKSKELAFSFGNNHRLETREMSSIFPHSGLAHVPQPHTVGWWNYGLGLVRLSLAFLLKTSGLGKKWSKNQHILSGSVPTVGQHMQNTRVIYARLKTVFDTISQYEDRNSFSL